MNPLLCPAAACATRLLVLAIALACAPALSAKEPAPEPTRARIDTSGTTSQGPPWLGVALAEDDEVRGVGVTRIMAKTPAARAGMKTGDRIVAVDGEATATAAEVQRLTGAHRPGEEMRVDLLRDHRPVTLTVTLEEKPSREAMVERQLLGRPAPGFAVDVVSADGARRKLADWRGKPTIIEFWATWCGPCRLVSRELAALKKEHGDDIHVVAISSEPPEVIRAYLEKHEASYPVGHDVDARAHDAYLISSFPTVILLDAQHQVSAVLMGAGNRDALSSKLETLVAESKAAR